MWILFSLGYGSRNRKTRPKKEAPWKETVGFMAKQLLCSFLCTYGFLMALYSSCMKNHVAAATGVVVFGISSLAAFFPGTADRLKGKIQKTKKDTAEEKPDEGLLQ